MKKDDVLPVVKTQSLFDTALTREPLVGDLLKHLFPKMPPQASYYELLQQGFLAEGRLTLSIDVWQIVEQELAKLMQEWAGPDVQIFIWPIVHNAPKNGVAYKNGICLFVSPQLPEIELRALFTHEYHHMCRRLLIEEPATLKDAIMMEGLAEHAVESFYGEAQLSPWTQRYSLAETQYFWQTHFLPALYVKGLVNYQPFLYGDEQDLPSHIGYCTGYRIVEAFQQQCGPRTQRELLNLETDDLITGAGFALSN